MSDWTLWVTVGGDGGAAWWLILPASFYEVCIYKVRDLITVCKKMY